MSNRGILYRCPGTSLTHTLMQVLAQPWSCSMETVPNTATHHLEYIRADGVVQRVDHVDIDSAGVAEPKEADTQAVK